MFPESLENKHHQFSGNKESEKSILAMYVVANGIREWFMYGRMQAESAGALSREVWGWAGLQWLFPMTTIYSAMIILLQKQKAPQNRLQNLSWFGTFKRLMGYIKINSNWRNRFLIYSTRHLSCLPHHLLPTKGQPEEQHHSKSPVTCRNQSSLYTMIT